jgi:hypothetical protein
MYAMAWTCPPELVGRKLVTNLEILRGGRTFKKLLGG